MNTNGESGSFELYEQKSDGEFVATGVYACSACRCVMQSKERAQECCKPRVCSSCGGPVGNAMQVCNSCRKATQDERDSARWDAAEKLPLDSIPKEKLPKGCSLWLYSERVDEFFSEVESLVEDHQEAGVPLDRVYLCRDDPGSPPDAAAVMTPTWT